ncbi:bifunctional hydroxymethylpyrimidine kinase/phosphomethylpyrimidine kinase [Numidum massiliense]|uniref:bifunctional hydroxymethylpyrimidine kinase/phosphomethylpyrimidine kinase n=1 Tax=Numidum massiliense TaxID=1522315 RepID=UPI00093F9847|nr:bifunctional hydroxymethylpyrimidine kinase/phosphomethylpyrimidine kinase [Numidum massiliense]
MPHVYKALTIAGTDPSGGAGIQADLKTFQQLHVYGMSVITAVVSQNTLGVRTFLDMPLPLIEDQLDAVFEDIRPEAIKTGMLSQIAVIQLLAHKIKQYDVAHYVMDPVMVAKSGDALLAENARDALVQHLLPLTAVVTPNIPEAEVITGRRVVSIEGMKDAAKYIVEVCGATSALVKGGHLAGEARDIFYDGHTFSEFASPRVATKHTHGTGCTLSAAITAELAKGASPHQAIETAKAFITAAIASPLAIGHGQGPVNHWAYSEQQNERQNEPREERQVARSRKEQPATGRGVPNA